MTWKRWAHAEAGNAADFDAGFYQHQPRTGLLGMSLWGEILDHAGDYSADGSPDCRLVIAPCIGDYLGAVFEGGENTTGASGFYYKWVAEKGGVRVVLQEEAISGGVLFPTVGKRTIWSLNSVGALGDLRGEDFVLELYMKNISQTARIRHLRVYAMMTTFYGGDMLR